MGKTVDMILTSYRNFAGASGYLFVSLAALVFLFCTEKNKRVLHYFLYPIAAIWILFLIPLYAWIATTVWDASYYRMLWFVPFAGLFAYAGVRLLILAEDVMRRIAVGLLLICLLVGSGNLILTDSRLTPAQNAYHVPQEYVDVIERVVALDSPMAVVVPREMLEYVRQVEPRLLIPYGRDQMTPGWHQDNELYDAMEASAYNEETIATQSRLQNVGIIVVEHNRPRTEKGIRFLNNYYKLIDVVGNYEIYEDVFYDYFNLDWTPKEQPNT